MDLTSERQSSFNGSWTVNDHEGNADLHGCGGFERMFRRAGDVSPPMAAIAPSAIPVQKNPYYDRSKLAHDAQIFDTRRTIGHGQNKPAVPG